MEVERRNAERGFDAARHVRGQQLASAREQPRCYGGEIVAEIAVPDGLDFFACMLGGDDGRTRRPTSAKRRAAPRARRSC